MISMALLTDNLSQHLFLCTSQDADLHLNPYFLLLHETETNRRPTLHLDLIFQEFQ